MRMEYWDREIETISREDLTALQVERLRETVGVALQSPFYSKRLGEAGVTVDSMVSLDDLKRIPFTTKEDLRVSYPDGMLAVPRERVVRLHGSSGTTGKSTVIFHTRKDIDNWTDLVARGLFMTGMRHGDVFQNMMTYGLFTGGLGLHYGAEKLGMLVIPIGSGNTKRQINYIIDFNTTAVHITPSYALYFSDAVREIGMDPKDLGLKRAIFGAEPYSDGTRRRLEEIFGIDTYNCYGLSELNGPGVGFDCAFKNGSHIWEDNFILELIDPDTGELMSDGHTGEIVLTSIMREGMPVLRYRTRDLATVFSDVCECGRIHRRISRIKGRTDDMMIVSGVNVFPSQIEEVLMNIPEVGTNYQICLDREGHLDKLTVKVEILQRFFHGDLSELRNIQKKIVAALKGEIFVNPRVDLVEPGTLEPSTGKARRVVDNREI
jgi:phenylacetate-CoA ligase